MLTLTILKQWKSTKTITNQKSILFRNYTMHAFQIGSFRPIQMLGSGLLIWHQLDSLCLGLARIFVLANVWMETSRGGLEVERAPNS